MISARAQFTPRNSAGQFIQTVVTPAVTASVQASLNVIRDSAQEKCPVDTGALRDSITVELNTSGATVTGKVGPHMFYAEYVEYGTGRRGGPAPYEHVQSWPGMTPRPYMRPAFDENHDGILELFRSQISTTLN